jgi:rhodanese-related sulfurtransferase
VLWQLLAIVGLSGVLGFAFNAASPVGVRFEQTPPPAPVAAADAGVKTLPEPPVSAPPAVTNPAVTSSVKPTDLSVAAAPPVAPPVALPTPWSVAATPANPNPVGTAPPPAPHPTPIHWPEAKALAAEKRAVLVDVRHKAMYAAGHIPGATSLPEASSAEEFTAFLNQQIPNTTVIVYCSSTSCSQSARVANRLVNEFRWPAVRYMTGGYAEYQQAELVKPAPAPAP